MTSLGTESIFIVPSNPKSSKSETISLGKVGWTPLGSQFRPRQIPTENGRSTYIQRDKTLGTDLVRRIPFMSPNINQDICFDDVIGDLLKEIEDTFGGELKQKLISDLKHVGKIETALLSESALAKDWLTPEEDEAWKDL
jgi:hypothetical protein